LIVITLQSCKKDYSSVFDGGSNTRLFNDFELKLYKVGNYPDASTIKIYRYHNSEMNSSDFTIDSIYNSFIPISDTTFTFSEVRGASDYKHYYTWTVEGTEHDTLAAGETSMHLISQDDPFHKFSDEINY